MNSYTYRESVLRKTREIHNIRPVDKQHIADQFVDINQLDGPIAEFVNPDGSVGCGEDSFVFCQTAAQRTEFDNIMRIVVKESDQQDCEFELSDAECKRVSTAGDTTYIDWGPGNIATFIGRSIILDRPLPLAFAIKISDSWINYARFAGELFVQNVVANEGEFENFTIDLLIGRFYNRYDFDKSYYKGWCVMMGILSNHAKAKEYAIADRLKYLSSLTLTEIDNYYEVGHELMENIAIGCRTHRIRSVDGVSK